MKFIEIIITPDGEAKVETKGFSGNECLKASRFLESALGSKSSDQRTGEFYRQASTQTQSEQQ